MICCAMGLTLLLLLSVDAQTTTLVITTKDQLQSEIDAWVNGNQNNRQAIGTWNVSLLEDFSNVFQGKANFNDDISLWDVSRARNMANMFAYAYSFNQDISSWSVSNVYSMHQMFANATAFNQDISGWRVHSVRSMLFMFYHAHSFNQNLCEWGCRLPSWANTAWVFADTPSCPLQSQIDGNTDLSASPPGPFCHQCVINFATTASSTCDPPPLVITSNSMLKREIREWERGNQNNRPAIGTWDVSSLEDFSEAFKGKASFNDDISLWDVSKATNMYHMFSEASSFNQDLSHWDVSAVESMTGMFHKAYAFNQDISGWRTNSVTDMANMFAFATTFNQDISGWEIQRVTRMPYMFYDATSFNQDISGWALQNVEDVRYMFSGAISFNQDISGWAVQNVHRVSYMFSGATSFNQDLSDWQLLRAAGIEGMFLGASSFNQNLCEWGSTLPSYYLYNHNNAFSGTSCPVTSPDPTSSAGPFCHQCPTNAPTSTTVPPTPQPPTPQPSIPPPADLSLPESCFSATVEVNVLGNGKTRMDELMVGDRVLTKSGEYKSVYIISHINSSKTTEFIQIVSNWNNQKSPLELTPNHLIFLENQDYPVPAKVVQVGDKICSIEGNKEVIAVNRIIREGLYNPITTDGTIVVNDGIIASTFTSPSGSGETHVKVYGMNLLSVHTIVGLASNPYSLYCQTFASLFDNFSNQQNDDGEWATVAIAMQYLHDYWSKQNEFYKLFIFVAYVLIFGIINTLSNYCITVFVFIVGWKLRMNAINKEV